jgi:hypothetical protein
MIEDIPAFLIRKKKRGRPRKIVAVTAVDSEQEVAARQHRWNNIKTNRYGTYYNMYLVNELPRFGCGYRVFYVKEGRKWARFTMHLGDPECTENRMRGRLSLKKWSDMKRRHEQCIKRNDPDAVKKRVNRRRRKLISNYA